MEKMITVHIADDHQILIDGVKAVLDLEPNIEVTGFSLNGLEVVEWFKENQADVLVLDINMPELDGIQVLKSLKGEKNRPEIIVLSSYDDVKLVKEVLQMGAKGFVPKKSAGEHIVNAVYKVVNLQDSAFATSGDYRIFFEINGVRYSHVINPRTGFPVANGVVSVSILASDCTFADGLATAIMVMGPQKGLALINRLERVEGLIVVEKPDGTLVDYPSTGFKGM